MLNRKEDTMALPVIPLLAGMVGASAVGSTISSYGNYRQQQLANQANRQLADLEWERNKEMWHMQNEYNTPASQMQRYRDAGLNPNLMYQQGTPGNASSSPTYSRPTMQAARMAEFNTNIAPMLQTYADLNVKQAQVNNIKAQTDLIDKQIITEASRPKVLDSQVLTDAERRRLYGSQIFQNKAAADYNIWRLAHDQRREPYVLKVSQMDAKEAALRYRYGLATYDHRVSLAATQADQAAIDYRFADRSFSSRLAAVVQDAALRSYQAQLREHGIMESDSPWVRATVMKLPVIGKALEGFKNTVSAIKNILPSGGATHRMWRGR